MPFAVLCTGYHGHPLKRLHLQRKPWFSQIYKCQKFLYKYCQTGGKKKKLEKYHVYSLTLFSPKLQYLYYCFFEWCLSVVKYCRTCITDLIYSSQRSTCQEVLQRFTTIKKWNSKLSKHTSCQTDRSKSYRIGNFETGGDIY